MDSSHILNEITISTPCPMDWNQMSGDDRMRFCTACGKHVHDFAKMTSAEADLLLRDNDWDVCGRLSQFADGTVMTADRSVVPASTKISWQFNIRSLMGVIAGFATTLGIARLLAEDTSNAPPPPRAPLLTRTVGKMVYRPVSPPTAPSNNNSSGAQPGCPAPRSRFPPLLRWVWAVSGLTRSSVEKLLQKLPVRQPGDGPLLKHALNLLEAGTHRSAGFIQSSGFWARHRPDL
jgi:hypothetical protein